MAIIQFMEQYFESTIEMMEGWEMQDLTVALTGAVD
jgi:hypothetical protein